MMNEPNDAKALKIAIVAGEESGDILGADLVASLRAISGGQVDLVGVGGTHLAAHGLKSLFDQHEIALMGFTAILTKVPRLLSLIRQTADAIIAAKPDALIIIDSPDFTHRVARKVKAGMPALPIINYISPSVWAWRQGRARRMRDYIDHVLAILPFEPDTLKELNGPATTYVGHRLSRDPEIERAALSQHELEPDRFANGYANLLLLPGSRRGEIRRSLPLMQEVIRQLQVRKPNVKLLLPTLPQLENEVAQAVANWSLVPKIVTSHADKMQSFAQADAALAASGTVTLETALCGIPTVSFYKTDILARYIIPMVIRTWSASLPNLIADEVLVPESYNEQAKPGRLMRQILALLQSSPERQSQVEGFVRLRKRMETDEPAGMKSARIVLGLIRSR